MQETAKKTTEKTAVKTKSKIIDKIVDEAIDRSIDKSVDKTVDKTIDKSAVKDVVKPEVTVVIPNHNGIRFLAECLRAIYGGDLIPEVIMVDNASTDGSVQWTAEHYPQVRTILFDHNTGFCKAVNAGISHSATEFVILLNNDTQTAPGFVSELLRTIKQDRRIFSVAAKMLTLSDPGKIDDAGDYYCALGWAFARGKNQPANRYTSETRIFAACAGAAIYRKKILEELGCFDETYFAYLEDIDIGYRAQIAGYYNLFAPSATVLHAGSAASGSRYNHFKTDYTSRNSIYLISKNMPLLQIIWNLPFFIIGFAVKFLFFLLKGMGPRYLKGLLSGISLSLSKTGRSRRTPFRWQNTGRYLAIQLQLYYNILRCLL